MAINSNIFPWEIPWTEEPGRPPTMGLQKVGNDLATKQQLQSLQLCHLPLSLFVHPMATVTCFPLKIEQYMNQELPDVQYGFRKDRGTRDQIANICWIIEIPEYFKEFKGIPENCILLLHRLW